MLRLCALLFALIFAATLAPRNATALDPDERLPYVRMALAANSTLHLVQYPLALDGKLELSRGRAFVSFAGGLTYAVLTGMAFSSNETVQHIGFAGFQAVSLTGAIFVTAGLIGCSRNSGTQEFQMVNTVGDDSNSPSCRAQYLDAMNIAIMASQVVAWVMITRTQIEGLQSDDNTLGTQALVLPILSGSF